MSIERGYVNFGNQFSVQNGIGGTGIASAVSYDVVAGLNIGKAINATGSVTFTIPSGSQHEVSVLQVVNNTDANVIGGTVVVSGNAPITINDSIAALSITVGTGKTLYNNSGTNYISY